jgi:hypothetical protein
VDDYWDTVTGESNVQLDSSSAVSQGGLESN